MAFDPHAQGAAHLRIHLYGHQHLRHDTLLGVGSVSLVAAVQAGAVSVHLLDPYGQVRLPLHLCELSFTVCGSGRTSCCSSQILGWVAERAGHVVHVSHMGTKLLLVQQPSEVAQESSGLAASQIRHREGLLNYTGCLPGV